MALFGQWEDALRQSSVFAILPRVTAGNNTTTIIMLLMVDVLLAHDSPAKRPNNIAGTTTIPPPRCNRTVLLLLSSCYCNKQCGGVEKWSHGAHQVARSKPIAQRTNDPRSKIFLSRQSAGLEQ
jgi:hypothetical protein